MQRIAAVSVILVIACLVLNCSGESDGEEHIARSYTAMEGAYANCEYSILTFKMPDQTVMELDINGLPVRGFWGAELLCQPCDNPANWQVLRRRGVSFADIFDAAGVDLPDWTPVNFVGRDGWDPWRTVLGCDPDKLMTIGYLRDYAYIYVGSPGLKDPSLPVDHPDNYAKDPLYPEMEGKSLCIDYDFDSIVGAQAKASEYGMEVESEGCFGQYRYKMLEKYSAEMYGLVEIDPQP